MNRQNPGVTTIQNIGLHAQGAVISDDGFYRYLLWRQIGAEKPLFPEDERTVCFLMLNPSTADARAGDPTVRRCMGFAFDWDFHRLFIVNLFAYRTMSPALLRAHLNSYDGQCEGVSVHYHNDDWIKFAFRHSSLIILAWGAHLPFECECRSESIEELLWEVRCLPGQVKCLGYTKHGAPRHPLMMPKNTRPLDWKGFKP